MGTVTVIVETTYASDGQVAAGILARLERTLFDAPTIQQRVQELARAIQRDYAGRELDVVALMDGSLFFVADLVRSLTLPIRLHTLSVSSYHGGTSSSGQLQMAKTFTFDLKGRHVLLIDDILDTGLTLHTLQTRLLDECQPATLRTAVLLDKQRPRELEVPVEYTGFHIPDEFVVGYGMDYNGHYRHLPCIGIIQPDAAPASDSDSDS